MDHNDFKSNSSITINIYLLKPLLKLFILHQNIIL